MKTKKPLSDSATGTLCFYKLFLAEGKLANSKVKLNTRNLAQPQEVLHTEGSWKPHIH